MCIPRNNHHSSVISDEYGIFFWILFIVVEAETQIVVSALNWEQFHLLCVLTRHCCIPVPGESYNPWTWWCGWCCASLCSQGSPHWPAELLCTERWCRRSSRSERLRFFNEKIQTPVTESVLKVFLKLFWECEMIPHTSLVMNTLNYFPTNKSWSWDFKSFT